MQETPKIIHQIWGGTRPVPSYFETFSQTWKNCHPDWQYDFWDDKRINEFVRQNYPQYWEKFMNFPHNVQRWDTIRYLIFDKIGGIYADCDTECLESIESLIAGKSCWFALEPHEHAKRFNKETYLSNAVMGAAPEHFFIRRIINSIFSGTTNGQNIVFNQAATGVLHSTGPLMITALYETLTEEERKDVHVIPSRFLSPFSHEDTVYLLNNPNSEPEELEEKLKDAHVVHYFFYEWLNGDGVNMKKIKYKTTIGITYMATGKYAVFWENFYNSCEKYLCPNVEKQYFVFTDNEKLLSCKLFNAEFIPYSDKGWLINVSSKCKCILSIREKLIKLDYVFYFNANLEFLKPVYPHEILPSEAENYLSALSFYKNADPNTLPFDRNPKSLACIPFDRGKRYFLSSFFGGRTPEFLKLCEWSNQATFADLEKGIVAKTHDESYLNRYLVNYPPKIIEMTYGTPEGWAPVEQCKGIFYNKDHIFGREELLQLREPFELHLDYLYNDRYEITPLSIIEMQGGLGSQMFQYAFMLGLQHSASKNERYYLRIHNDNRLNEVFGISNEIVAPDKLLQEIEHIPDHCIKYITESNISKKNGWKLVTCYSGRWRSEKYFEKVVDLVKKHFQLDEKRLNAQSKTLLKKIKNENSVAIHIRYGKNDAYSEDCLGVGYYQTALEQLKKETKEPLQIYLFSNNPDRIKANINIPDSIIVDWNKDNDDWQDMCLMGACKYIIIADSCFGWWAAWLGKAEKTVCIKKIS
ncbi:MAG: alpha-1,2-fucosyltransferase [Dysgonamonadaceae bacterium]|jgi:hypothetical protein|nr:alpha-1,2-fucosyltransferase [Dysgonamonadaceae bacterium]